MNTTNHVTCNGIEEDDDGFTLIRCDCGALIGPAPDSETVIDSAMEHAYGHGWQDAMGQENPPEAQR